MSRSFRNVFIAASLFAFIGLAPEITRAHGGEDHGPVGDSEACASLLHHPTIGTRPSHVSEPGERLCFAADLPAEGIWLLDTGASRLGEPEPRLEVLGSLCETHGTEGHDTANWQLLGRSADSAVVRVASAGRYSFCVSPRDYRAAGDLSVSSTFADLRTFSWTHGACTSPDPALCPPPLDHDPEHEPDPDPIVLLADTRGPSKNHDPEHEPDPDPFRWIDSRCLPIKDHDPEHEPDPDPLNASDCRAAEALRRACGALRVDDHSDLEVCATAVAVGTDREGMADLGDSDVFRVDIDEWTTVHFHLEGTTDEGTMDEGTVYAGLYSRHGHRLGSGDAGGSHHIVETLAPGSYFLRVEGDGAYRLRVEDLDAR